MLLDSAPSQGSLVYAEIDLQKLKSNFSRMKSLLKPDVKFMAAVKGNAYGHGIVRLSQELEVLGADYLAVSNLYEALQVRKAGVKLPILIFGYVEPQFIALAIDNDITMTVDTMDVLNEIAARAHAKNKTVPIHIQVDTGMHLYGIKPQEALELILAAEQNENILLEGVYSHFADAEADDLSSALEQLTDFKTLLAEMKRHDIEPPLIHMANGAAVVRIPDAHFNMVRVGTFLYGPQTGEQIPGFIPEQILSLKTKVIHLLELQPHESVGYSKAFVTTQKRRIATLPIGYGDGFRKSPNWGYVLINGQRAPIVDGVTMDKTAVDVTHLSNVTIGDEVVLLGQQQETITLNDIANKQHAANYEILTGLTERVVRIYI